jgi:hypothetical protein
MSAVERLAAGVSVLRELLSEPALEPDPARADWAEADPRLTLVQQALRRDVLPHLEEALAEAASDPDLAARLRNRTSEWLGAAAGLLLAAGRATAADELAKRGSDLAVDAELRAELEAARREPESFVRLIHGRWLIDHGRTRPGSSLLKGLVGSAREEALQAAARKALGASRPVTKAPALIRLNGIGAGLYGRRDARPDGSYVATYCVSVLWVPILPLTAYRVLRDGDQYLFMSKEPLSALARGFRLAVVLAAVAAGAAAGVKGYLESPGRRARLAFQEARALEQGGNGAAAMERYRKAVNELADRTDVTAHAEALLRLTAASVKEPCTPEQVDVARRVVAAFEGLPPRARAGGPTTFIEARLRAWAQQVGRETPRHLRSALSLLDLAVQVGGDSVDASRLRKEVRGALAGALARGQRPLDALAHYARLLDEAPSLEAAGAIISGLGDSPSLWLEAEREVVAWCAAAEKDAARAPTAARFRERLARAKADAAAVAELIEAGDVPRIRAASSRAPSNQELAAFVAEDLRSRGDPAGCLAAIGALAPTGRLTADAQRLLGACHAEAGHLAQAEDVLSALLDQHLEPFLAARRDYNGAAGRLREQLVARAEQGQLPLDLRKKIESVPDAEKRELYGAWFSSEMDKDPRLAELRGAYLHYRPAVLAALTFGTVQLRLAGQPPQAERQRHLEAAERAFLAIREEGEGTPEYHLSLGQVWHRLGRPQEGARELDALLERKEPGLTLAVAHAYRELGITSRSRQIAEGLYESASEPAWKQAAAFSRSFVFLDLEDQERWLQRADPSSAEVKTRLLELQAERWLEQGKGAEADRSYAQAAALRDRDARHHATAANNAAMAYLGRFRATGEVAHLRAAVTRMESAVRLEPESALLLTNLGGTLEQLGVVSVLEGWVRLRSLLLDHGEVRTLADALLLGPLGPEVAKALQSEPALRRSLDVSRQEQVLSPQNADAYKRQLWWLRATEDAEGLAGLRSRLDALAALDAGDREESRRTWLAGTKDAEHRRRFERALKRAEDRVERARQAGHAPTLAAAHLLQADAHADLARMTSDPAGFAAALQACRRAQAAWPQAGLEVNFVNATLVTLAGLRAAEGVPSLKAAWAKEGRVYGPYMLLHRASQGPDGAAVVAALRRTPELTEAATLARIPSARRPTLNAWIVARLAGDAALESAARRAFSRPDVSAALGIDVKLDPGNLDDQAALELYLKQAGQPSH